MTDLRPSPVRALAALAFSAAGLLVAIQPAQAERTSTDASASSSAAPSSSAPAPSGSASASASEAPSASASAAPIEPPRASMGEPTSVRGPLPAGLETTLRGVLPMIETCYREAIASDGDLEPTMSIRLRVVPPGTVAAVMVNDSVEASSTLRGCVRDAFAGVVVAKNLSNGFEALVPLAFTRHLDDGDARPASACTDVCDGEVDEALQEAVRLRAQAASHCFRRAPSSGEPKALAAGTLELSLRIAPDGSVCGVSTMADPFGRASLATCLVEAMSAPLGVEPKGCATVDVPFTLKGT